MSGGFRSRSGRFPVFSTKKIQPVRAGKVRIRVHLLLRCSVVFNRDPEGFPFSGKKNPARMSWESKNQGASTITMSGGWRSRSGRFPVFSTKKIQPVKAGKVRIRVHLPLLSPDAPNPHPEGFPFSGKKNPARKSWESKNQGASTYYDVRWLAIAIRNVSHFFDKKNPARKSWKSKNQGASTITTSASIEPPSGTFPIFRQKKSSPNELGK